MRQFLILLVAETRWGRIEKVTFELLADARKLASSIKGRVEVALLASPEHSPGLLNELALFVDEPVHLVEHPALADYSADGFVQALQKLSGELSPSILFIAATAYGRDYGPRLAARMGSGYLPHCLTIRSAPGDKIDVTRVTHGGRVHAQSMWALSTPAILTMKPGVADAAAALRIPAAIACTRPKVDIFDIRTRVVRHIEADPETQDIREAERIVAGGKGVGSAEGFAVVRDLAAALRASVAASRVAVDQGWIEHARQVGQTGKTVAPKLYIAAGISGASHHLMGMRGSEKIVALNRDRQAPIFSISHFGVVGDLHELLPKLAERIRQSRKES